MATLGDLHALLLGSRLVGDPATPIGRVHSDTRTLRAGDLFVALRGERFDGHDHLPQARTAGAAAVLAERGLAEAGLAGLEVADARLALGALGAAWRARFAALPLVAVGGSNGKTTTTQMLASILRAWKGEGAFATEGNFNNDIGLPLTLLRLREGRHTAAVVELGMNHPGEIASLAAMARPTVAVVTNAQREHLEFMRDVAAVALENGGIVEALGADGVAVFPIDDAESAVWQRQAGARRTVTFGAAGSGADVTPIVDGRDSGDSGIADTAGNGGNARLRIRTPQGTLDTALAVPGAHNVRNALAATAAALAAGAPLDAVARGLAAFRPVKGRSQLARLALDGRDVALVDDTYNANPDSVRAAIELLATLPAPRWLVLGDMGEVGDQGPAFHREVGAHARAHGIETVWAAGAESGHVAAGAGGASGAVRAFATVEALVAALGERPAAASILVKGSRFMRMERVVQALQAVSNAGGTA